jgi:hypothetical protein
MAIFIICLPFTKKDTTYVRILYYLSSLYRLFYTTSEGRVMFTRMKIRGFSMDLA